MNISRYFILNREKFQIKKNGKRWTNVGFGSSAYNVIRRFDEFVFCSKLHFI